MNLVFVRIQNCNCIWRTVGSETGEPCLMNKVRQFLARRKSLDVQKLVYVVFDRYIPEDLTIREDLELLHELKQEFSAKFKNRKMIRCKTSKGCGEINRSCFSKTRMLLLKIEMPASRSFLKRLFYLSRNFLLHAWFVINSGGAASFLIAPGLVSCLFPSKYRLL